MREFTAARAWVWGHNFESTAEWFEFCSSGDKPEDIPRSAATQRSRCCLTLRDLSSADHGTPSPPKNMTQQPQPGLPRQGMGELSGLARLQHDYGRQEAVVVLKREQP
jgi:hypothetical protein